MRSGYHAWSVNVAGETELTTDDEKEMIRYMVVWAESSRAYLRISLAIERCLVS